MKRLLLLLLLTVSSHLVYGQACGIYRIHYKGTILPGAMTLTSIRLPATPYLHGLEKENAARSFFEVAPVNGTTFEAAIQSHLTTPYNDKNALLAFYRSVSPVLKIKVTVLENGTQEKKTIEIPWDKITVTVIDDGKFGTLFEFDLGEVRL